MLLLVGEETVPLNSILHLQKALKAMHKTLITAVV